MEGDEDVLEMPEEGLPDAMVPERAPQEELGEVVLQVRLEPQHLRTPERDEYEYREFEQSRTEYIGRSSNLTGTCY